MPLSDNDRAGVVELLTRDVRATIGPEYEAVVLDYAEHEARFVDDLDSYRDSVVQEVQQHFHDTYIDTTWPACPRHPQHPLWLRGEYWYCEKDGEPVAKLGELANSRH